MLVFVKLLALVIIGIGVAVLLNPEIMKRMVSFWEKEKRLYGAGVLRILFGIILLLAASQCRVAWIIALMGILFLVGGIVIFALRLKKIKAILKKWQEKPLTVLRLLGLVALLIGTLILNAV